MESVARGTPSRIALKTRFGPSSGFRIRFRAPSNPGIPIELLPIRGIAVGIASDLGDPTEIGKT